MTVIARFVKGRAVTEPGLSAGFDLYDHGAPRLRSRGASPFVSVGRRGDYGTGGASGSRRTSFSDVSSGECRPAPGRRLRPPTGTRRVFGRQPTPRHP